jgi:hypothetical protein
MLSGFAGVFFSTPDNSVNAFVWRQDEFAVERCFYGNATSTQEPPY